jgi:hypothetical protein
MLLRYLFAAHAAPKDFPTPLFAEKDQKSPECPFVRAKQRRGFDIDAEMIYVAARNPRFKQQPVEAAVKFFLDADTVSAGEAQQWAAPSL